MKVVNLVLNTFTNDSRVLKISKSLSSMGKDVCVVALYEQGLEQYENIDEVKINRIKLTARVFPKMFIFNAFRYLEFVLRFLLRYEKIDVIHCNDIEALFVGAMYKVKNKKVKIVYDCHEHQTERIGLSGVKKSVVRFLEKKLIPHCDEVICVSGSIAKEYSSLYKIPTPHLILNCPVYNEQVKHDIFRKKFDIDQSKRVFIYQGLLSKGRGVELLIDTFSSKKNNSSVLVFMGYGPLENLVKEKCVHSDKIYFHEAVSPNVILKYTSSADFGVSIIEDLCLSYRYCLPNKVFEYVMAGLPILTSNLPELKLLVDNYNVGMVAEEPSVESMQNAIGMLLKKDYDKILSNIAEARKFFCWENQEIILKKIYNKL